MTFTVKNWKLNNGLAEVELTSADEKITMPEWLEPFVVREVTEKSEYTNYELSK